MLNIIDTKIKPLSSDVIFKAVFKKQSKVLQKMVCDTIGYEGDIYDFQVYVGEELLPNYYQNRKYITDLIIVVNKCIRINLEINRYDGDCLTIRNIIYFSSLIDSIGSGTTNKELANTKAIQINFNNYRNSKANIIEEYAYQDKYPPYRRMEEFAIVNLDIAKSYELVYNDGSKNSNVPLGFRWAAILFAKDIRDIDKILGDDMLMKQEKEEFLKTIDTINHDNQIVQAWALEKKYRLEEMDYLQTAERKGKEEGIKKGKVETITNVIKNMLNKNVDYETIADFTNKSVDDIMKIANSLNG